MGEPIKLDYFPPQGTRYEWHPPTLTTRPWWSRPRRFDSPDRRSCSLQVWRTTDGYQGQVVFYDTAEKRHVKRTRWYASALRALRATEDLSDAMIKAENLPAWADEAFKLGWSPR